MSDEISVNGVRMKRQWIVIYNDEGGDDCSASEVFEDEEAARDFLEECEWKAQLVCGYDLKIEDRT